MKFEDNPILQEIDDNFVAIANSLQDIQKAHEVVNEAIITLSNRITDIEKYVSKIATPDKIQYKPPGQDYMNMKENYDYIYDRLDKLEGKGK